MNKKLYNPKLHAPSVYIPNWLIQVPTHLISTNAKVLYGRLAQWANEHCQVFRSSKQLSEELGTPLRTIERHLYELRNAKLINTAQPQKGGINHFEFLQHPWMECEINSNLVYKSDYNNGHKNGVIPPAKNGGTPPPFLADINIKEIKERKEILKPLSISAKSPDLRVDYRLDSLFMNFYKSYPNKQKPLCAHKAFLRHKPTPAFVAMLINDVQKRMAGNWNGRHKSKIPHPATYLNSKEWEGELFAVDIVENKYRTARDILKDAIESGSITSMEDFL